MSLTKITDASVEPVTLQEAKLHLRVIADLADVAAHPEDALIAALITAARTDCEDRLQRSLMQTTWKLEADAFPCGVIRLERAPIISVDTLKYFDADETQQTLATSAYRLSGHRVEVVDTWPATQPRIGAVELVYKAGYGTTADKVPAPIKAWILLAMGDMYTNRERSAERPVVAQGFADGLLDGYKIWAV
jgi:uncharacterized phiE125 gp8 family phage protein